MMLRFLTYMLIVALLQFINISLSQFTTIILPKQGIVIEPNGLSIYPSSHKFKKISIAFPTLKNLGYSSSSCLTERAKLLLKELQTDVANLEILFTADHTNILFDYCTQNSFLCSNQDFTRKANINIQSLKTGKGTMISDREILHSLPLIQKVRRKRFLMAAGLLLAGGIALGSSVYNTISLSKVRTSIDDIQKNIDILVHHINSNEESIGKLTQISKDHTLVIKSTLKKITQLESNITCKILGESYVSELLSHLIHIKTTLVETCHNAITGRLTIGMLDPSFALSIISSDAELSKSIYNSDISVFYTATKVYPIAFDSENSLLHMLLYIPIIHRQDISPTYTVSNYGWIDSDDTNSYKIVLPDKFTLVRDLSVSQEEDYTKNLIAIPINYDKCELLGSFHLCSEEPREITPEFQCVLDIIHNKTERLQDFCRISGKRNVIPEKIAINTKYGVFIRGYKSYDLTVMHRTSSSTTTKKISSSDNIFIDYKNFKILSLEGKVFLSASNDVSPPLFLDLKGPKFFPIPQLSSSDSGLKETWEILDKDYKDLNDIKTNYLSPFIWKAHVSNPFIWIIFVILMVIVIALVVLTIKNKRKQKSFSRSSNNHNIALRTLARRLIRE